MIYLFSQKESYFKKFYLEKIAKIISFWKIISSLFQYSERTIASTETNNTSKERSDTQLFGAGKFEGVALSGGLHAHLPQEDIEKKSKFNEANWGWKKKCANFIHIIWGNCMPIAFELNQGLLCVFTNCQTYSTYPKIGRHLWMFP